MVQMTQKGYPLRQTREMERWTTRLTPGGSPVFSWAVREDEWSECSLTAGVGLPDAHVRDYWCAATFPGPTVSPVPMLALFWPPLEKETLCRSD
jgi:hypothetical protein